MVCSTLSRLLSRLLVTARAFSYQHTVNAVAAAAGHGWCFVCQHVTTAAGSRRALEVVRSLASIDS